WRRPPFGGPGSRTIRRQRRCCPTRRRHANMGLCIPRPQDWINAVNALDLQPHLVGDLLELRPLRADDWEALFAAASDPKIWELHPAPHRYQENVFREFFREALESRGALVAVDRKTHKIIGSS